jgi:hypothetical protein
VIRGDLIIGKNREKLCFPRDENGKVVDTKNGKHDMTELSYLNVKYKKEIRLILGCDMVTLPRMEENGLAVATHMTSLER